MQVLSHHCYSPNIGCEGFVLFLKVKDHLNDITLTQDTLKSTWEQATRTVNTKEFAAAFCQQLERNRKCTLIADDYVKKS
jgi:hypothetical protein